MRADSLSLNYCFHSKGLDGGSSVKILNRFTIFFLSRMATVSKDGTWKIWDIDGEFI